MVLSINCVCDKNVNVKCLELDINLTKPVSWHNYYPSYSKMAQKKSKAITVLKKRILYSHFFHCQCLFLLPASRYWFKHSKIYLKLTETLNKANLFGGPHYPTNKAIRRIKTTLSENWDHPVFLLKSGLNCPTKLA